VHFPDCPASAVARESCGSPSPRSAVEAFRVFAPHFKPVAMNVENMKVILYHDTAIVTGDYHAKGTYQGKPYDHYGRFTDTWFNKNGTWQCVARHSSLVKKQ
jgi:ketosteroid isomerase-like protein